MDITDKIARMIEPALTHMGYDIVQLKLADGGQRKTLSLMAERTDGVLMGFNDCTEISHTVSALMDVEDPISTAYDLEVLSPGIDRPLVKLSDYERYAGYEAKFETYTPLDGRKRFKGKVGKVAGETITIETDQEPVELTHSNIRTARLIATDALVAEHLKKQKQQQKTAAAEAH